ncbi:hypothetical protein BST61_g390 [Cercospora zeina]
MLDCSSSSSSHTISGHGLFSLAGMYYEHQHGQDTARSSLRAGQPFSMADFLASSWLQYQLWRWNHRIHLSQADKTRYFPQVHSHAVCG